MSKEKWEDTKHNIMMTYYLELFNEHPIYTRAKEIKNRHVAKRAVLKKIDL